MCRKDTVFRVVSRQGTWTLVLRFDCMEILLQPQAAPRSPPDWPSDHSEDRPKDRARLEHTGLERPSVPPTAFDRWVQTELMNAYEAALREPVPDELLRLINDPVQGRG
jgi:hypothetical protein